MNVSLQHNQMASWKLETSMSIRDLDYLLFMMWSLVGFYISGIYTILYVTKMII